jgi:hypothetical protein
MERTPILLMTALLLVACGKSSGEDLENAAGAGTAADIAAGIYDGEGAVLKVTDKGDRKVFAFAHSFERSVAGAEKVSIEIVKGTIEAEKDKAPQLRSDEIYPCSATVAAEGANVVASGRCRGKERDFKLTLVKRDESKLRELNGKWGAVTISNAGTDKLDVTIDGLGEPTESKWIYGGGVYQVAYGNDCHVNIIVRSTGKELLFDVGSTAKAIDIDPRGGDGKCGALNTKLAKPERVTKR